jgi:hypothetical protein
MGINVLSVIFPFFPMIRRGGKFGASMWLPDKNSSLDKSTSRLLSATSSSRVLIHPWQLCLFTTVNAELTSYPFYRRPYFFKFTPLYRPLRVNLTRNHIDQRAIQKHISRICISWRALIVSIFLFLIRRIQARYLTSCVRDSSPCKLQRSSKSVLWKVEPKFRNVFQSRSKLVKCQSSLSCHASV